MGVIFGRKGVNTAAPAGGSPQGLGKAEMDERTDDAIASLSRALRIDLDFDIAYVFAPSLWFDPSIKRMIDLTGIQPESRGNKMSLLKNPQSVARFAALSPDEPLRQALVASGFGMVQHNPLAANGYNDQLAAMQQKQLKEWAGRSELSDDACMYAVIHLHKFSTEVMQGKVPLG